MGRKGFFRETFNEAFRIFTRNDIDLFSPGASVQREINTILYFKHLNQCQQVVQEWSEKIAAEDWKQLLVIVDKIEAAAMATIEPEDATS
jgi:hypothetical protein